MTAPIPDEQWSVEDNRGAKEAAEAIANFDLGPSQNEDVMLTLYDLIPDEWIGPAGRLAELNRLSEQLAWAAISAWLKARREQQEPPR